MLGFNIENADLIYILIVFVSSAIPWAYYIGKLRLKSDIRNYGDKNPGTVNVFRAGSITWGFIASFFEITKSGLPIYFFLSNYSIENLTMIIFVIASLFGHGFSPFLKFKGGKSLAVTAGTWLAITKFEAFYIITPCLAIMKLIQKNDAITVTVAFSSLGIYLLLRNPTTFSTHTLIIGILFNLLFIIFKHRKEYKEKIEFRFKLK
tara:strand:- start:52420 stop:53037 length:618 start_codon:yes stop_codon:yes gene_type:complete